MRKIFFLLTVFCFFVSLCYADSDYMKKTPSAYTWKSIYDRIYLNLSGSNANQNINIGTYNLSANEFYSTGTGTSVFNEDVTVNGWVSANTVTANSVQGFWVSGSTVSGNTLILGGSGLSFPKGNPADDNIIKYDLATNTLNWETDTSGGGHTIQDEGVSQTQRTKLNFVGAGVTVSDGGAGPDSTIVTIPGGGGGASSGAILFTFDGAGSAIATGASVWVCIPYNATITEWNLTSYSTAPSLIVTLYKSTYSGFYPDYNSAISGAEIPTITGNMKNRDTYLTTWTTGITAGDYVYAKVTQNQYVTTATSATRAVLYLGLTK